MPSSTSNLAPKLDLALFQFSPRLRDVAHNLARIREALREREVDLLVTPELSLTGYDLRDDVHTIAGPLRPGDEFDLDGNALVGLVDRDDASLPFNAAALVSNRRISFVHRKIYLPTYGMFDEGRYFGRGRRVEPFTIAGWRFGILVCEDFWHPMLAYLHALQGAHVFVVMAAAPGRGAWEGGEEGGFFASSDSWERIARTYAQLYGVYVVVCNRIGVEGGVTFAGESVVVAPGGRVVARCGVQEELLHVELEAAAVTAARTPYAHLRDEDARLAIQELQRVIAHD